MNRNNSDNNTEAVKIANALKPFAKKWFDEWGQSCVRSKKMTVSTPPNGSVIGVKDAFSDTEVFIKYMSSCSNADVGDTVWCKWMYDNMQTLYADEIGNLRQPTTVFDNSSSGNYARVVTFSTNMTVGKNLLNDINPDVKNAYITGANKLGASANDRLVIIPINPNTYYTFTWVRDAIEGASSDDTNVLLFAEYPVIGTTVGTSTGVNMGYSPAVRTFNSGSNLYAAIKIANTNKSNYQATLSASQLELGQSSTSHEAYVNTSNINVNAPITIEYAKTGDVSPTTLTIVFNRDYTLQSFTKNASADAYLVNSATARWDLYIGKNNSSDSVNVLDFHNPWSNSDMVVEWANSSISTLPTGTVSATPVNTVISEAPNGVSVASGSWKTVASITLTRGIWILSGYTQYNSNSTGIRSTVLSESQDDGTSTRNMSSDLRTNTGNNTSKLHFVDIYQIATQTTYYLNAYQNSGSAITTYGRMVAIKIV
jgi:hypothetical protein